MKLLSKSLKGYIIYSVLILLISVPAYYYVIKSIVAEDVDEDLLSQKADMVARLGKVIDKNPSEYLEVFEPDVYIKPTSLPQRADSFYTISLYEAISKENVPHRVLESIAMLNGKPYQIQIKSSLVDNDDLIISIVTVQAILMLLIIAGLLLIARFHSKKIWKPFYATLGKLHEYKIESEKSIELEKTEIDEFADLNKTISSLTNRNHEVYLSQKEFTENASHEMQTPLAVFQSKVELLMQTTPLNGEQAELITELSEAGQRMNRLNKTLLLLSKIDNNQFNIKEAVNIDTTVQKLAEQYMNALNQKNISMHTRVAGDAVINANQTLIEILIGNLLSNAIRHNVQGGRINIVIEPNQFNISNTGNTKSLDASRLFQRFQKQTADANSVGLGLEIAKRICNLYKADITYNYADSLHCFNVRFNNS
ncbi:MAG: HAMP domain-containing histidine kinase [Chitinophagaceae bacterium]|jgi:signal transduction histidine kinase|nr:HAMP domain-containing histidine kinase [Chitinophagaceae bacterium]